jgi:hypothetical protein
VKVGWVDVLLRVSLVVFVDVADKSYQDLPDVQQRR